MGLGNAISRTAATVTNATVHTAGAVAGTAISAAGAAGGAALGAGTGAVRGASHGAVAGAESGSRSTPAVVLTAVALGATGIIDWPIVLAAGGTALLVNRLTHERGRETTNRVPATRKPAVAAARKPSTGTRTATPRARQASNATSRRPRKSTSARANSA